MAGRKRQFYFLFLIPSGLLLTLSLFISLALFGADRAFYSWTFFSHRLAEAGAVLSDDEVQNELVDEITDSLVKELGQNIPYEVRLTLQKAARESFTGSWMISRAGDVVKVLQGFLKGQRSSLDYALPLGSFKSILEKELRQLEHIPVRQVEAAIREIPNQILFSEILGPDELAQLERKVRTYPLYANGIMYGLPFLFIMLIFVLRKISWCGVTMGSSFVLSSGTIYILRPLLLSRWAAFLATFLPVSMRTPFHPLIKAAMEDYGAFLNPALILSLISGILIIPGAVFIEKALVSGRLLTWLTKISFFPQGRVNRKK